MHIHDWTRVTAGIFHDFHHSWISTLKRGLNEGLLPAGYYALAEQVAGGLGPDVLALETGGVTFAEQPSPDDGDAETSENASGGVAVATTPPQVAFTAEGEGDLLVRRKNRIAIRHKSDHRVVSVVEVVSPGNKNSRQALEAFEQKAYEFITAGVHLLLIDLFPPGPRDPRGIHDAVWSAFDHRPFAPPPDKPLTLAAYSAGLVPRAYVEPVAVGQSLPEMPVFLTPETYVPVPLDDSYAAAFAAVPAIWRRELDPPPEAV